MVHIYVYKVIFSASSSETYSQSIVGKFTELSSTNFMIIHYPHSTNERGKLFIHQRPRLTKHATVYA